MNDDTMRDYLIGFDPATPADEPHYRIKQDPVITNAFALDLYNPVERKWKAVSFSLDRDYLVRDGLAWEERCRFHKWGGRPVDGGTG